MLAGVACIVSNEWFDWENYLFDSLLLYGIMHRGYMTCLANVHKRGSL